MLERIVLLGVLLGNEGPILNMRRSAALVSKKSFEEHKKVQKYITFERTRQMTKENFVKKGQTKDE